LWVAAGGALEAFDEPAQLTIFAELFEVAEGVEDALAVLALFAIRFDQLQVLIGYCALFSPGDAEVHIGSYYRAASTGMSRLLALFALFFYTTFSGPEGTNRRYEALSGLYAEEPL